MSYKCHHQGDTPSARPTIEEITDYWEIECLLSQEQTFSSTQGEIEEDFVEEDENGRNDEIDSFTEITQQNAFLGIADRQNLCSNGYPFTMEGNSIRLREDTSELIRQVYSFLLLATRIDMKQMKMQQGVDGAALFERLCNEVLRYYFGRHSRSFVFGTGNDKKLSFAESLKELVRVLDEPELCPKEDLGAEKDGGIDVVACIPFKGKRGGSFACFAQCKTGTNWRNLRLLSPDAFCKQNFISQQPLFTPIAALMVAESASQSRDWNKYYYNVRGLLFDRMRIMQYLPEMIPEKLQQDILVWNKSIKEHLVG